MSNIGNGKGCRAANSHQPTPTPNRNLKNTDFVDTMTPKVLRDLSFSRNQPLKLADDLHIRILKKVNKIRKSQMNLKTEECTWGFKLTVTGNM
jgi:transposase-like protein